MNDMTTPLALDVLRNRSFDEIAIGDRASLQRTLTAADIQLFAALSGDVNPTHLDAEFAASTPLRDVVAHGMWAGSLISAVLGTQLPGPGTSYLSQTLEFLAPVHVGDMLTITVTVTAREPGDRRLTLDCRCVNAAGALVIAGLAVVRAPAQRLEWPRNALPQVRLEVDQGDTLVRLLQVVRPLGSLRTAVVYPSDAVSLSAALDARAAQLIEPVLIGPRERLQWLAAEAGHDLGDLRIEDAPDGPAAAARAVELALAGEAEALMKGSLHTDELMAAVVASKLRTARRMSHCFMMQTPFYPRPFIITDAAINIAPTLAEKADIVRNAVGLAHAFGIARPRVAVLAAVETVNVAMPATPTPSRCARWPTAARLPAPSSMARSPSTTPSRRRLRAPRASPRKSPAPPTSSSCRTWRAATCSPSSSSTWAARPAQASCSGRACPSC
jgi:acyl dehydratase